MGKCLVTKLKETVNNDSLVKIGEARFLISSNANYIIVAADTANKVQLTLKGGTFDGGSNQAYASTSTSATKKPVSDGGVIEMTADNKYNITYLSDVFPVDFGQLAYSRITNISHINTRVNEEFVNRLNAEGVTIDGAASFVYPELVKRFSLDFSGVKIAAIGGNLASLSKFTGITELTLRTTKVYGDIDSLKNLTELNTLSLSNSADILGDIKSLGKCTKLTNLSVAGTGVSGTLEDFVKAQRAAGRTAESTGITVYAANTNVTFNGIKQPSQLNLTWTANTITFGSTTVNA